MAKIVETIHIRAPPEKVFALVKEFERSSEWNVGWKEPKFTSNKRYQVGATGHLVVEAGGQRFETDWETTEWMENERFAFRTTGGNVTAFGSVSLKPSRGGTELRNEINYTLPYSILGKIIDRLKVSRDVGRNTRQSLLNVKKMLEK